MVMDDKSSSSELVEKATRLYNTWKNSLVPEQVIETKTLVAEARTESIDEPNRRIAKIVNEKGWDEGVK